MMVDMVEVAKVVNNAVNQIAAEEAAEVVTPAVDVQAAFRALFEKQEKVEGFKTVSFIVPTEIFTNLRIFSSNADAQLNRDHEARIKQKKNIHLRGEITSQQQLEVAVVLTTPENEEFYQEGKPFMILGGHSRSAAHKAGQLQLPPFLRVTVFFGLEDDEITHEYKVSINSLGQATVKEITEITNKLADFKPESAFVSVSWKDAFKKQFEIGYEEGIERFGEMLTGIVDKWGVTPEKGKASTKRHSTGVKMAILRTYEQNKEDLTEWETFWKDFFSEESTIIQCKKLRTQVKGLSTHQPKTIEQACEDAFNLFFKAQARKAAK